ncbi:ankyrin repeat domain-containing protein [Candidatus Thiodiazotropha sp. CDECU1]|uniref:ankyrin repeat domain-containing protein n=1 Tax=Candidatus Thiodiazotropha sp. CDECU1 TaxID=3065865 RepID=UPI00292EEB58|nr:ankyrin repeat domain-containing protein [Candidatus Thiodiazotropha sp. CDECU1]
MKQLVIAVIGLFLLPSLAMAAGAPFGWQREVTSLVSQLQYEEAGEKLKGYCIEEKSGELCLVLASAYFEGEVKFGIQSKDIVEAYKYTKLACDFGSVEGCEAYKGAVEKGELLQLVLYEPGVKDRDKQLKKAIQLGLDPNVTTMFSRTLLQEAVSEEKIEAVRLLLENGVDVNYRVSEEDLTPLMYAINTGSNMMVKLLLEYGADPEQTMKAADYLKMGKQEVDACDFANKLENREMLALLKCGDMAAAAE